MSADTKPSGLAALRDPFGPEHVGLLPKISCGACSKAREKHCDKHSKKQCQTCGNWITERHVHLDYVGHGAVTDRLLAVDPSWSWEPLAFDAAGMPTMVYDEKNNPIAMWIKLTVCGVTRLGVGTCPSGQFEAEKVLIGDALRNAAMRFGVALDLWIKGQAEDSEAQSSTDSRSGPSRSTSPEPRLKQKPWQPKIDQIKATLDTIPLPSVAKVQAWAQHEGLPDPDRLSESQADQVLAHFSEQGYLSAEGEQQSLVEAGS